VFGDLRVELDRIRHEVVAVMEKFNPALKRRTEMILATVWLGVTELRTRTVQDPERKRELINEFWRGRNTVEKAIRACRKKAGEEDLHPEQEPRRALS
jgi:hypothetical protein